jgi:hypothetical protein
MPDDGFPSLSVIGEGGPFSRMNVRFQAMAASHRMPEVGAILPVNQHGERLLCLLSGIAR